MFAAILDPERGGTCRISPAGQDYESLQAYDESTNVLQTLFRTPQGVAQLTDFMPWSGDDERFSVHELHRLLEVREGSIEIELVFDPRFDYGRGDTRVSPASHGALAEGPGGQRIALAFDGPVALKPDNGRVKISRVHTGTGISHHGDSGPVPFGESRRRDESRDKRRREVVHNEVADILKDV